jgi:hypothetical protein
LDLHSSDRDERYSNIDVLIGKLMRASNSETEVVKIIWSLAFFTESRYHSISPDVINHITFGVSTNLSQNFKRVAVYKSASDARSFDLKEYLSQVLLGLRLHQVSGREDEIIGIGLDGNRIVSPKNLVRMWGFFTTNRGGRDYDVVLSITRLRKIFWQYMS